MFWVLIIWSIHWNSRSLPCWILWHCRHYNNAFYARVGGVSNAELNRLELELLFMLDFGVVVSSRVFESYCLYLEKEMLWNGAGQRMERAMVPNSVDEVTEISVDDTQTSSSPPQMVDWLRSIFTAFFFFFFFLIPWGCNATERINSLCFDRI